MNREDKIRERIRIARTNKEYSQYYVGQQLQMSQIAYHKLENGKTQLKVKTLLDLAVVFRVEESYLLGCDE